MDAGYGQKSSELEFYPDNNFLILSLHVLFVLENLNTPFNVASLELMWYFFVILVILSSWIYHAAALGNRETQSTLVFEVKETWLQPLDLNHGVAEYFSFSRV